MRRDWERNCLMSMAAERKDKGLSREETVKDIEKQLSGFATRQRIRQAVRAVFGNPLGAL